MDATSYRSLSVSSLRRALTRERRLVVAFMSYFEAIAARDRHASTSSSSGCREELFEISATLHLNMDEQQGHAVHND